MSNLEDSDIIIKELPDLTEKENYKLKILVVGESGVGKTNLIRRFTNDVFTKDTKATVGVEFICKTYKVNKDIIKLEIWDTAGQERYKSITSAYYKGSKGVLIVYDITNMETFEKIEQWLGEVKEKAGNEIKVILVGNKLDLEDRREVTLDNSLEKAIILNCPLMETSALDSTNVSKVFIDLLKEIYIDIKQHPEKAGGDKRGGRGMSLDTDGDNKKEKGCCKSE